MTGRSFLPTATRDRPSCKGGWTGFTGLIMRPLKSLLRSAVDDQNYTVDEYLEKISTLQTDKEGTKVVLYASNKDSQHSYIQKAKAEGYDVVLLDSPIAGHWIQKIEGAKEKVRFARVDSDMLDKLIPKEGERAHLLTDSEKESLKGYVEGAINDKNYSVRVEALASDDLPMMVVMPEYMRRMKEMQMTGGGGMMGMGDFPDMYDLIVNANHPLASKILDTEDADARGTAVNQALDLAKLQQNLLHGEELTAFITRSYELLGNE